MDDSSRPQIGHSTNRLYAAWLSCEAYALRAPLRFSLLVVLALLATAVVVLRIGYDTIDDVLLTMVVGSSRVDLQACKLEYSIVSPK